MATTSPDNLRTPNPGDPYNLVADLATLASDTQVALNKKVSNLLKGTTAERTAATGTSTNGMLWQDTDGIKMLWRKDGAAWVPAVQRWIGSTAQRDGFTQAPNGFEWYNTSDDLTYLRRAGAWSKGKDFPLTLASGFSAWAGSMNSTAISGSVVTVHLAVTRASAIGNGVHLATLPILPKGGFFAAGYVYGNGSPSPLEIDGTGRILTPSAGMPASITVVTASFSYIAA